MIRKFLRDSILYTGSIVLTRGISFLLLPLYTTILSPDEFGTFDYINVIGSFVLVTATLEISQGIHRFMPEARENLEERRCLASTALVFTLACYAALILLFWAFSKPLATLLFGAAEIAPLLAASSLMFASSALLILIQAQLRSELRIGDHIRSAIIVSLLSAAFSAIGLLWFQAGVMALISGITLGNLAGAAYAFRRCREVYSLNFSLPHLKELLQFSAPLVPSSVGVVVALLIDRIMIKNMMSLEELGIFGVAARIAALTSLLSIGIQQALTPLIYNKYREKETPGEIARLFWLYFGLSIFATLAIWAFSPLLLTIMAPPSYHAAAPIVPLVCCAALTSSLYIFSPGLALAKKTSTIAKINIFTAAISLGMNFILIPYFGLLGAALGTLSAAIIGFLVHARASQSYYPIPFFANPFGRV